MNKVKVSEATNTQLDWLVASYADKHVTLGDIHWGNYSPTSNWSQMGPIIERENISVVHRHRRPPHPEGDRWNAVILSSNKRGWYGPTPLIAAARCYVASKLGDVVEVPEELT